MIEEDGDDGSENECTTGMWDTERSRSDMSHFDDSIDVKTPSGALSHSAITTNRIQSVSIRASGDAKMDIFQDWFNCSVQFGLE